MYRIDYWYADGSGSEVFFERSHSDALRHVPDPKPVPPEYVQGIGHVTIQEFSGPSCNMNGWRQMDGSPVDPEYYKYET